MFPYATDGRVAISLLVDTGERICQGRGGFLISNEDSYGWNTGDAPESCGYVTPRVLQVLASLKVRRVCDLGSGNGALAGALKTAGYEVAGVEIDSEGVKIARSRYPEVVFYNCGIQDDPAVVVNSEGKRFDAVVSTEVIEHLFAPELLPTFATGLLRKKDGFLILSTPYHGYMKNLSLSILDKWDEHHTSLWTGGHIKFWSRSTLTKLLAQNGYQVTAFHGCGRFPLLWKSMVIVARSMG